MKVCKQSSVLLLVRLLLVPTPELALLGLGQIVSEECIWRLSLCSRLLNLLLKMSAACSLKGDFL